MADIDFAALLAALSDRIESLVRDILPGGRRLGHEWVVAAADSPTGCSISVRLTGAKAGCFGAWAAGKLGDALDLITLVVTGGNKAAAIRWAQQWLGKEFTDPPPAAQQKGVRAQQKGVAPKRQEPKPDPSVLRCWQSARLVQPGDPVWLYLEGRGIDLAAFPHRPGALRYHPALWHKESGREWPAMVALVCDAAGQNVAVHRTWLEVMEGWEPDEHPTGVRKAPVEPAKKALGGAWGGCIHLGRGASGKPWSRMPEGETLLLGEGIEDVLSGMRHWPHWRAACGISLPWMLKLALPAQITTIAFLRQRDPRGSEAYKLTERILDRFQAEGRRVLEHQLPTFVKDINELDRILRPIT